MKQHLLMLFLLFKYWTYFSKMAFKFKHVSTKTTLSCLSIQTPCRRLITTICVMNTYHTSFWHVASSSNEAADLKVSLVPLLSKKSLPSVDWACNRCYPCVWPVTQWNIYCHNTRHQIASAGTSFVTMSSHNGLHPVNIIMNST